MKFSTITLLSASALLALSACGKGNDTNSNTPGGDMVEVQQGTISDDMIMLDQAATDGTAVDYSVPIDSSARSAQTTRHPDDDGAAASDAESAGTPPAANSAATPPAAAPPAAAPTPAPATQ